MSFLSSSIVSLTGELQPTASSAFFSPSADSVVSVTGSASFASSTGLSTSESDASGPLYFGPDRVPGFDTLLDLYSTLNTSLGLLLLGLLFAGISFGAVCMKALIYARHRSRSDGIATRVTVAALVLTNIVQMAFSAHAVYTSVVVDFGSLPALLNNEWSIIVQIGVMTLTAAIAQSFFVCRLHYVKRNLGLTITALLFILLQLALSIFSVVEMFHLNYITVMLLNTADVWPMTTTFSISAGLNLVLATLGYVWLQRPYRLAWGGRTSVLDEAEYWTLKSLFFCGVLSVYNAVAVLIMGLNLSWLAVTFVLGNLYTLSVLLNITELRPTAMPIMFGASPEPPSEYASTRRASTATLTPDTSLWEDIVKAQRMYPVGPIPMKATKVNDEKYVLGYQAGAHAV